MIRVVLIRIITSLEQPMRVSESLVFYVNWNCQAALAFVMPKIKKLIMIGFFVGMAYPSFGQKRTLTLSAHEKLMLDQEDGVDRFIKSFELAVGRKDTAAIKKMIHFPLRTARRIYMPCKHWKDGVN